MSGITFAILAFMCLYHLDSMNDAWNNRGISRPSDVDSVEFLIATILFISFTILAVGEAI